MLQAGRCTFYIMEHGDVSWAGSSLEQQREWTPGVAGAVATMAPMLTAFRMQGVRAMFLAILFYVCASATIQLPRHHFEIDAGKQVVGYTLAGGQADGQTDR